MSASSTQHPPTGPLRPRSRVPWTAPTVTAQPCYRAAACSCELHTEAGPAGTILVLRVAGEIDLLALPVVQSSLTTAVDQRPVDLVVDLAAVSFCCVRGLTLLATSAQAAQRGGIGFALSGLSSHLDRIATLLWPEQRCMRYRSAAAAVTAIRADQTYRLS